MNGKRSVRGAVVAALLMLLAAVPIRTARAQTGEHASPSAASVSNLIQELRSPDLQRRRDAARELSNIEPLPSEAIAALAQALQDEQPNGAVQNYASIGLSKAGARAIPALAGLTRSRNPQARQAAIATLGRMAKSTPDAWPLLIDAFRQPSGRGAAYMWGIADQLARVGPPVIPLLRKALEDPDPHVRAGAAATLAQMGDFDRHWSRNNPYVRKQVNFVSHDDLAPFAPQLANALNDPDASVREEAALALAYADPNDKRPAPILIQLLESKDLILHIAAIPALTNMGSAAKDVFGDLVRELPANPALADAVADAGGEKACAPLAQAVANTGPRSSPHLEARALVRISPRCPQTIPVLAATLGKRPWSGVDFLAEVGKPAVPALTEALKSPDLYVREDTVAGLAEIKPRSPEVVAALMIALKDKSLDVRSAAASALQNVGGEAEKAALTEQAREEKIYAQQSKLDRRGYSRQELIAPIPADEDHKYPLTLAYLFPLSPLGTSALDPKFLITLNTGKDRPERLVFWKKVGRDRYQQMKVIEPERPDFREFHFEAPITFTANVSTPNGGSSSTGLFVDVPMDGWRSHIDQVFAVERDGLYPVEIESAEKAAKDNLGPRESFQFSAGNRFSNGKLEWALSIWNADDPMCCPSAGSVVGTYKVIREGAGPETKLKMVVASATREAPPPRPVLKKPRVDKGFIWAQNARRGSPPSLAELLSALKSPDLRERGDAAVALQQVKPLPPAAMAALAEALKTPDPTGQFQLYAFNALSIAGAPAIPAIASFVKSDNEQTCRLALQALGRVGLHDSAAWPVLLDTLKGSASPEIAPQELAKIGPPIVPSLRKALNDNDPHVRSGAAKAFRHMGEYARLFTGRSLPFVVVAKPDDLAAAARDLDAALNDPDRDVRFHAAIALAWVDPTDHRSVPVLVAIIEGKDRRLGETAFNALQRMGASAGDAAPALKRALARNPDPLMRALSARALAAVAGTDACASLERATADKTDTVRTAAINAMAGPPCPGALHVLIATLGGSKPALFALAAMGKSAGPALAKALKSHDARVRENAAEAFGLRNPILPGAVDPLVGALNDDSLAVRAAAARALQNAGGEAQQAAMAELKREQQIYAQQAQPQARRYIMAEIVAPIPPDAYHAAALNLACLLPIYSYGSPAEHARYIITLHRGRGRPDHLTFWKKTGEDQYQRLAVSEAPAHQSFATTLPFQATVQSDGGEVHAFVDVPTDGPHRHGDRVFVFDHDRIFAVEIESAEKWYERRLAANEAARGPVANSFSGGSPGFSFAIWKAGDPLCCPTGGRVVGTYKIIKENTPSAVNYGMYVPGYPMLRKSLPPPGVASVTWKMAVDTAEREPLSGASYPQ